MKNAHIPRGFSVLELVFVLALGVTVTAAAVPQYLAGIDDFRTAGAAHYISMRFQRARTEAVKRSSGVALVFTQDPAGYTYAAYVDGNANGVLARDIQRGTDVAIGKPERLSEQFTGVDFGAIAGLPPVDPGGTPPGSDPIRLGAASSASFSALGTCTSGTVYIRGRNDAQYAVRIFGETGRTRLFKFERGARQWRPL